MKLFVVSTIVLSGVLLTGGCATKKYVRQTTAPVQAKVDQVADQANKQGQEIQDNRTQIKQVDDKASSGISAAQERAQTADTRAGEALTRAGDAMNRANQANEVASQNTQAVSDLRQTVANLDDYKMATEVTIPFSFNQHTLTKQAKEELDQLAANLGRYKRYFIAVEGYTDRTGAASYNDQLSQKRADAVMKYLVANHNVPVYRIHMIGLGEQKPAEEGQTRAARAKNRRVEVRLFTADQGVNAQQATSSRTMSQVQGR